MAKVSEIMPSPLFSVDPEDTLLKASGLMQQLSVKKLVATRKEIIYGIITADDITHHCDDYVNRSIRDVIRWIAPWVHDNIRVHRFGF
ncbi:MAG: hypothetical protein QG670_523 [Thermoproteota archaeon]|nr:hypothetical protein [Thermoproteota archaeon]